MSMAVVNSGKCLLVHTYNGMQEASLEVRVMDGICLGLPSMILPVSSSFVATLRSPSFSIQYFHSVPLDP